MLGKKRKQSIYSGLFMLPFRVVLASLEGSVNNNNYIAYCFII